MSVLLMMNENELIEFFKGSRAIRRDEILTIGEKHHMIPLMVVDRANLGVVQLDSLDQLKRER